WTGTSVDRGKTGRRAGSGGRACRDRGRRTRFPLGYAARGRGVQAGTGRPDVIMSGTARRNGAVSSPVVSLPNQVLPGGSSAHMVVCGDDGLAHRLAAELRGVYGEQVTLVVPPSGRQVRQPVVGRARAASAALLDRVVTATVNRGGGNGGTGGGPDGAPDEREVEAAEPTESVLADVGVDRA